MDPISQGVLGASLPLSSQADGKSSHLKTVAWLGCIAGMAPDIDVFIQSPTDPILFLEYHRQFTHSLIFIPIGALICSLLFHRWYKKTLTFKQGYLVCFLGYATHGLLDACTTYGTLLLWPFSDMRVAWNNVSVVDPLFTLPILVLVIITILKANPIYSRVALVWGLCYLLFGALQRERAESQGWELAISRGHEPIRLEAKPGFGNLFLWKVVYEADDRFYVDGFRMAAEPTLFEGESIKKLNLSEDLLWLDHNSQQGDDLKRFNWFSNNYLGVDPNNALHIIDIRYSMLPNEISPLWGIIFDPKAGPTEHVIYRADRARSGERLAKLMSMLTGRDEQAVGD
jgi:inner membrane protein